MFDLAWSTATGDGGGCRRRPVVVRLFAVALLVIVWAALVARGARAAVPPGQDPFYAYDGATPLADIAPGTVLKTRVISYHVVGVPLPVPVVQLLYRSTGELGQPTVNVTSVLQPATDATPTVVSYQSLYDSLNPDDEPSYQISGGVTLGGVIANAESLLVAPALLAGDTVVIADTEGENADFAAGREEGMNTLDSLRAALNSPATGLTQASRIGLIGYSGGAIATEWAAELAPSYAPDVNEHLVGAAIGGVLVDPDHNLYYVQGSSLWAGIIPLALIGLARAFDINMTPYLSSYGQQLFSQLQDASILDVLGEYPGLTWAQLFQPQYPTPDSIPGYDALANLGIMGTGGTPTVPLFIGQGAGGAAAGTASSKTYGAGDGVMITGDVRALANEYCDRDVTVQYDEYDNLGHLEAAVPWFPEAAAWLAGRFAGLPAPDNCGQAGPGNSLAPLP